MEIPTLPTDNLYKFMALSGVALVIAAVYFITITEQQYADRFHELRMQAALVGIDLEHESIQNLGRARKQQDIVERADRDSNESELRALMDENLQLGNDVAEALVRVEAHDKRNRQIRLELDKVRLEYARWGILRSGLWMMLVTGTMLSSVGFYLWYVRVQRYLDAKFAVEARQGKGVDGEA